MTCFGDETFGPVDLALPLPRRGRRDRARQRRRVRPQRLDLQPGRRRAPGRSPGRSSAARSTSTRRSARPSPASTPRWAACASPGMGRRQGGEGILRYTESQSVAHPAADPVRADARDVRRDLRQGDDRQPPADEEARPGMSSTTELRLRRPGRRLRLRRLGHRAAADREGLPGRRARGRRPLRGRRLRPSTSCDLKKYLFGPDARLLRHPAHRRRPRLR